MPASMPVLPDGEFQDDIAEMDAARVPDSELPYVSRIESLFQLKRSFEFFGADYSFRVQAILRLFSRLLASANERLVVEARERVNEYCRVTSSLVEDLDASGCVGTDREQKEEHVLEDLLDRNKQLYALYGKIFGRFADEVAQEANFQSTLFRQLRKAVGVITERSWGHSAMTPEDNSIIERAQRLLTTVDFSSLPTSEDIGLAQTSIFLGGGADEHDLQIVEDKLRTLVSALEVVQLEAVETTHGSIFRRFIAFFQSKTTRDEIEGLYGDARDALRAQQVGKPRSETIDNLASAAAALLTSLEGHDNAILRLGELVVVKHTHNGIGSVAIETISAELARKLESDPELLKNPRRLMAQLSSDSIVRLENPPATSSGD